MAEDLGKYLWQNGEQIALEKENDCLSVYIYDQDKMKMVEKLDGVLQIKHVFNEVYRLKVVQSKMDYVMDSLRSKAFDLVSHHAYKPLHASHTRYYITDKVTVKFKEGTRFSTINKVMDDLKLRYVRKYNEKTYLFQVTASSGMNPVKVANKVAQHTAVQYSEPNLISRFSTSFIPTDEKFVEQWHLKSQAGPELLANADIGATKAWDITRGSRSIVIAVLDDGFDLSHPDFQGSGKIVHPKDFVDGDANPLPGPQNYHGTPCAGVAIAEANSVGSVGVAPGCAFMPVRIPFGADANLLFDILDYVGKRADVLSCSWGPPPVYAPLHSLVYDKIKELAETGGPRGKGCVIIFAAHNFNAPLKQMNNSKGIKYLAGNRIYEHKDRILNGNATHPDVIAVSANTSLNKKAAYSNWGKEITVSAPSNNYHPLDPNMKLKGRGICTTDNFNVGWYFSPNSHHTTQFGGTSSAAPVVSGVAGLILSANPSLTAKQVKQIIIDTADKIVDTESDIVLGHTKGSYDANGHSEWFGYGKINAHKAVLKAQEMGGGVIESTTTTTTTTTPTREVVEPQPIVDTTVRMVKLEAETSGRMAGPNSSKIYKVIVGRKLVVEMKGTNANTDFDLYFKKGGIPTKENYDERAITETSSERVVFEQLQPGEYYVMVNSFRGSGEYDLKFSLE